MAGSLSDYGENKLLDYLCSSSAWADASAWFALSLADPLDDNSGLVEPDDDGDYERSPVAAADFGAAGAGSITTVNPVAFCAADSDFSQVSHFVLMDTSTGAGNALFHGDLSTARDVTGGDTVTFAAGKITVTAT